MKFFRNCWAFIFDKEFRRQRQICLTKGKLERVKISILRVKQENRNAELHVLSRQDIHNNERYLERLKRKKSALKQELARLASENNTTKRSWFA